jgi:hypothetical protein
MWVPDDDWQDSNIGSIKREEDTRTLSITASVKLRARQRFGGYGLMRTIR